MKRPDFWDLMRRDCKGKQFSVVEYLSEPEKTYQVFEVLVVDVLKQWARELEWEVTPVNHDHGVDFIGKHEPITLRFFSDVTIDWRVLGQVKRMTTTRLDAIRLAFLKMRDAIQEQVSAGKQVIGVMFVVSSKTRPKTVERMVTASLNPYDGPRWYDPAERFLSCFAADHDRIHRITRRCFTQREHEVIRKFLSKVEPRFDPKIEAQLLPSSDQGQTGKTILRRLVLGSAAPVPVMHFRLRYRRSKGERNVVEITRPSALMTEKGFATTIDGPQHRCVEIWLRSFVPGRRRLGAIEILDKDGRPCGEVDLGTIHLQPFMEPRYFEEPNAAEEQDAMRYVASARSGNAEAVVVIGSGGSGKSRFCERIVDRAADDGFEWFAAGQTNAVTNGGELLRHLLLWLVSSSPEEVTTNDDVTAAAKRLFAGRDDLVASIGRFVDGEAGVDEDHIATALTLLLAARTRNAPVIIHLYDLHWMANEGFAIIRRLIEYLRNNAGRTPHGVMILLEGRDRESLYEPGAMAYRVPIDWFQFQTVTGLPRIAIRSWSPADCRTFLDDLISRPIDVNKRIRVASQALHDKLIAHLEHHATGNPMHLVEQLKRLHDVGIVRQHENGLLYVRRRLPHNFRTPERVEDLIRARIDHFRRIQPIAPELLTVLARIGRRVPADLFNFLAREAKIGAKARLALVNMDVAHVPASAVDAFEFRHENYFNVFRDESVNARSRTLSSAIRWYEDRADASTAQKGELIRLLDATGNHDGRKMVQLVSAGMKESRAAEDDLLLEQFIRRYLALSKASQQAAGTDEVDVRYELAKVMTRIGSWEDAAQELERIVNALGANADPLRTYQWIRAKAELANVYLSQQDCDAAVRAANDGLRLLDAVPPQFDPDRLREKLLHRIAVALWFDGRAIEAAKWQWQSYKISRRRNDPWARTTILREIGTISFHRQPELGVRILSRALDLARSLPHFSQEPLLLIEAQRAMGKLLVADMRDAGDGTFRAVRQEAVDIYVRCQKQQTKYEATLAALVCGAASARVREIEIAYDWFRDATAISIQAALGDEIWKARLNLAQVALELGEREEAKLNAREALDGLVAGLRQGDVVKRASRRALMALPLAHVARICGPNTLAKLIRAGVVDASSAVQKSWETRPRSYGRGQQQVLHVRRGDYDYFLMN